MKTIYDTLMGAVTLGSFYYVEEVCDLFKSLYPGCRVELHWTAGGQLIASAYVSSPAETKNGS